MREESTGSELITLDKPVMDFDQQMLFEMAYGMESADDIRRRYNVDDQKWFILKNNPYFRNALAKHISELKRNGGTFKAKAQMLAEDVLPIAHAIATDKRVPVATRLEAAKWLAKVSGMDESDKKDPVPVNSNNIQVNINLG